MNLLLDSHTVLWWSDDPSQLSQPAADAIDDPANEVWASAASAWELAMKASQGKLSVAVRSLFRQLPGRGVRLRGIGVDDGIDAAALVWTHRDPFDRMLVAQARRSNLTIVTRDETILQFVPDCVVA